MPLESFPSGRAVRAETAELCGGEAALELW